MAGTVLLTHALLIDSTGREPVEGATVVVEGPLIKDVALSGRVWPLGGSVTTLDLRDRTLMPGLIDAHVHVAAVDGNTAEQHRVHPPSLIAAKALRRGAGMRGSRSAAAWHDAVSAPRSARAEVRWKVTCSADGLE